MQVHIDDRVNRYEFTLAVLFTKKSCNENNVELSVIFYRSEMPSLNWMVLLVIMVAVCLCYLTRGLNVNMDEQSCNLNIHDEARYTQKASYYVAQQVIKDVSEKGYNVKEHVSVCHETYVGNAAGNGALSMA